MANPPRVLIDLDVILDVLQRREPFYAASAHVLGCAETGQIEGWIAGHGVTTLYYLLSRFKSPARARVAVGDLLSFMSVATVDEEVITRALALPISDFEDAVQVASASQAGLDYLVTRNVRDYPTTLLPVLHPAEIPAIL